MLMNKNKFNVGDYVEIKNQTDFYEKLLYNGNKGIIIGKQYKDKMWYYYVDTDGFTEKTGISQNVNFDDWFSELEIKIWENPRIVPMGG